MIGLNFSNMMSEALGEKGLTERQLEALKGSAAKAHEAIAGRKLDGLAFMDLPGQDTSAVREAAAEAGEGAEYFVLLGIGGSALGPKTILEALSPMHNLRRSPKVFIYDNVDPMTLSNVLSIVEPEKTTLNVVTKSGSTAETMASFMLLYERFKGRIVATTDPEKGYLRELAGELGLKTLSIPGGVGGRYSVLCPVGLLLAEVVGVSSDELLRGAADMNERCRTPDIWENPAYMFGSLLYLMDVSEKRSINVLMPYSDRLRPLSEWYCQLWAESLGKQGQGSTPYPSLGTTDQHSQLQLWMEGPEDKVIVFVRVEDCGADMDIPRTFGDKGFGYLGGHTLSSLMDAEEESTELCLSRAGRPNMTITVPRVDAYHLGQLFQFFAIATVFAGLLYGVNPFDQPSVEEGKNFTYGMMGRKGYEARKREVIEARRKKERWKI